MTILLFIPIYQRQHITAVCFAGVERLRGQFKKRGHELIPFVIWSHPDDNKIAHQLEGSIVVKAPNRPLGRKLNMGLRAALDWPFDYFMQIGSDDLISVYAVDLILEAMRDETKFFGFTSLALYDMQTGRAKSAHGLTVFGAGRCVRRDVLEKASQSVKVRIKESFSGNNQRGLKGDVLWMPKALTNAHCEVLEQGVALWDDDRDSALDYNSERVIEQVCKTYVKNIQPSEDMAFVLDIKSGENIHDYDKIQVRCVDEELSDLVNRFPELEMVV